MNMELREWLLRGLALTALSAAIQAQQNPPAPDGAQPAFQQRLNTIVQRRDGGTNQNPEAYDPLSFYRKNPELMRRYFPHLYQAEAAVPAGGGTSAAPQNARDSIVLESFKFNGGTAAEFADMLKKQLKPEPNIIIAPKLRDTPIPEFELQNVTLADLFQALNNVTEDKSVQWQLSGSTEPIWVLNPAPGANNPSTQQGGYPGGGFGFPATVDPLTGLPIPMNNGRVCQILPLGKYLTDYKVEDITTAVKTAWSMMGDDAGAQLKYHTDTKLLIAVGTNAQLAILTQVLSSLESGMEHKRKTADLDVPVPTNKPSKNF
jgi:hypothetical protein